MIRVSQHCFSEGQLQTVGLSEAILKTKCFSQTRWHAGLRRACSVEAFLKVSQSIRSFSWESLLTICKSNDLEKCRRPTSSDPQASPVSIS
jgi:hypothetical protein